MKNTENKFVATMGICNAMGIGIIAIDDRNDAIRSQFSNEKRSAISKLRYRKIDAVPYFKRYGKTYYLDDFIRTNI